MPKDLTRQEDTQKSLESQESSGGLTLKIPEGKTPVYFLSSAYEDGYIHWLDTPQGRMRVVCSGGLEGKGYAPDTCKVCAYCADQYARAKQLDLEGKTEAANKIRAIGNEAHAKYEAHFVVAKGEMIKVKDPETGEKRSMADFDDAEVGILSMTGKQYQDFMSLRDNETYPFIKSVDDLLNRAILLDKAKRDSKGKKARYATIEFKPARNQSDKPKVEYKPEDYPLADNFKIDVDAVSAAYNALLGKGPKAAKSSALADDAYESEEAIDDFGDDGLDESDLGTDDAGDGDFLDDVEGDEASEKKAPAKKAPAPAKKAPAKKAPATDDADF